MHRSRRVVIAVKPQILGDTIARVLDTHGLDVTIYPDAGQVEVRSATSYDVALITGTLPEDVDVDTVVCIPETAGSAVRAVVSRGGQDSTVALAGVADVADLVARLSSGDRGAQH